MKYVVMGAAVGAGLLLLLVFVARNGGSSGTGAEPPAELKAQFPAIVYYYDQVKKNKLLFMCDQAIEVFGSGWGAHGLCRVPLRAAGVLSGDAGRTLWPPCPVY